MKAFLIVLGLLVATACSTTVSIGSGAREADQGVAVPAAEIASTEAPETAAGRQVAVLAGGCFWGVEGVFEHVTGVVDVVSGYAGGTAETATYKSVGTGSTGHAEAVQITYDPSVISYAQLLQIYFAVAHDPTELDRQGPDVGTEYRSTIFPLDDEQARIARSYLDQLARAQVFAAPIVTTIESGKTFYPAEDYHQDFMEKNPDNPYIQAFDAPKLVELKKFFPELVTDL